MAGFVLEDELDKLEYDFRPHVDSHGVIPEPSSARIAQLRIALQKLYGSSLQEEAKYEGKSEAEVRQMQIAELNSKDNAKEADAVEKTLIKALAIACSGKPSEEELKALPYRGRLAFMGWIVGKFLTPENATGVTSQSQGDQPTA